MLLKLRYDEPLSNFAFNFILRRYIKENYIPPEGPLQSYRDYISTLPMQDQAEAFGQHPNADISYMITVRRYRLTHFESAWN
jgi:hypothetical protein